MIGVDTNVLVRLLVVDDVDQHRASVAFFAARTLSSPAFVSLLVVAETFWVLSKIYKVPRGDILTVIEALVGRPNIVVEDAILILRVVEDVREKNADFADVLIAAVNAERGCRETATFDRKAAGRLDRMTLLA